MLLLVAVAALAPVHAQEGKPPPEDPAHEDLRTLRREMVDAINKDDVDALLKHLDKDVVVTWMDGEVSRKPEGVRAYIMKMTRGDNRKVQSYSTEATVDELTHLYGNTGVAFGRSDDHFVLTDGRNFTVHTRWTATLVKKDGKWLLAAFHASTDMFDNPVLDIVRQRALWTAVTTGVVGIAVGFLIAWLLRRPRAPAPASVGTSP
jgi:ketosteroid isomerase-like protein